MEAGSGVGSGVATGSGVGASVGMFSCGELGNSPSENLGASVGSGVDSGTSVATAGTSVGVSVGSGVATGAGVGSEIGSSADDSVGFAAGTFSCGELGNSPSENLGASVTAGTSVASGSGAGSSVGMGADAGLWVLGSSALICSLAIWPPLIALLFPQAARLATIVAAKIKVKILFLMYVCSLLVYVIDFISILHCSLFIIISLNHPCCNVLLSIRSFAVSLYMPT